MRTLHYEWSAAESDVGVPISCNSRYLNTIRTVNLDQCLEDDKKTPIVSIDKRDVKTGHLINSAILRITRSEALILLGQYPLGYGPNSPAKVIWQQLEFMYMGYGRDGQGQTNQISQFQSKRYMQER